MDDAQLVQRCQSGEHTAFERLYERYARKVLRTAYLITGNRLLAEEAMQEAFVLSYRSIGQLREPRAFSSWLYRTAVRVAQRQAMREQQQRVLVGKAREGSDLGLDDLAELRTLMWSAIERLPLQQRVAVVLHYYEDHPVSHVADLMDAPEGTVKSWLSRARTVLARELGESVGEGGANHGG